MIQEGEAACAKVGRRGKVGRQDLCPMAGTRLPRIGVAGELTPPI